MRIARKLDRLAMPHFRKFQQLLEARWFGENKVPHRIFCYAPSGGRRVIFLCGCTHKDNRYNPTNAYATAIERRDEIEHGGRTHVSSISKLWRRLRNKAYRDGYTEAQLSIEIPFQIRALRKARNWTQAQLAERCGIPQARISHIEQPGRDPLSLRTLYRLASAFDVGLLVQFVSFSELVRREDQFHPETFRVASFEDDRLEETVHTTRSFEEASRVDGLKETANKIKGRLMKLHYYPETDSLYIELKVEPGVEIREIADGFNVDLDSDGEVIGFDIDHASKRFNLSTLETEALPVRVTKAS